MPPPIRAWSTAERLKRSIAMQGNRNAVGFTFSDELLSQYGTDPDLRAWIDANKKQLDQPSSDGTQPKSEHEVVNHDELPLWHSEAWASDARPG